MARSATGPEEYPETSRQFRTVPSPNTRTHVTAGLLRDAPQIVNYGPINIYFTPAPTEGRDSVKKEGINPTDDELFNQCITVQNGARTSQRLLYSAMQASGYADTELAFGPFLRTKFMDHAFVRQKRANYGRFWQGLTLADDGDSCNCA